MNKVLGIDPGKHSGIAIAINGKLSEVYETNFWGAIEAIDGNPDATVVIELPTTKHVWHNQAKTKGAIQRTGVNVGSCIREAELLVDYLVINHRNYKTCRPLGKIDKDQFKRITGWIGRTNSHMRDAGMLAFGLRGT